MFIFLSPVLPTPRSAHDAADIFNFTNSERFMNIENEIGKQLFEFMN